MSEVPLYACDEHVGTPNPRLAHSHMHEHVRCRAKSAHTRQSGPNSCPGFQGKVSKTFPVVPASHAFMLVLSMRGVSVPQP